MGKIKIDLGKEKGKINPNIYGHFAEHLGELVYNGLWVGSDSSISNIDGIRKDVVEALKLLNPPVIRWPGGCFADDYHWRDGIGPREDRPTTVNIHWDSTESNEFGTHEFLQFCELVGAKPYICSNVGSGTPKEMRDWLEYLNFTGESTLSNLRAKNGHPEPFNVYYFGIGNENWGCGGSMSPKYYAYVYKRFATFAHSFNDGDLYKIACGPFNYNVYWTRGFFRNLCENKLIGGQWRLPLIDGFAMHYYCGTAGTATKYSKKQWYELLKKARKMQGYIRLHKLIMNYYDRKKKVGLIVDEWGTWHKTEEGANPRWLRQQNTIRDALVAAHTLDIFNNNADIVVMSNIAQTVNVLQAMILTKDEKMVLTPTYYVYKIYAEHQGGLAVKTKFKSKKIHRVPILSGSASLKDNVLSVSMVNSHASDEIVVKIDIKGAGNISLKSWQILATEDIHDHNTFEDPEVVKVKAGDISEISENKMILPPASVNIIQYEVKEAKLK
ncbi:MAG: alpha-N-arabinofuranosidase [Candidatus Lokiarchaeota archaeon]|nr:alpha-N-arabinofuranosidase [Candidatus Lokiarchaeota archaeon]